ncbi:MAG TPA: carboxypeptidase regulatory-like domain-containing protein [Archangium sp.]|jgi:hypothetical protein|uniref:carboxypeptidase regulatory-like domain-containing protein n=1 Tax=Archangium sp. TaxID=1872627 RepID=UPI002ED7D29D
MIRPATTVPLLLTVLLMGCANGAMEAADFISCHSDSECGGEQVCFPEGCGDPGQNIVVEVVPNPKGGLHAQDFRVDDLRSEQNIELFDPATLQGSVRVESMSSAINYSAPITLRLTGESLLIPGVVRRHESTLTPDNGGYTLPVGAGHYTVTLLAPNTELPPQSTAQAVLINPGRTVTQDFLLPASSALVRLSGWVLGRNGLPVDVDLEAQALDDNLRPLSQRVAVKRATGELSLALPPSASLLANVILQVRPTSPDALVPQQTFTVNPRLGLQEPLSMGDYGAPVTLRGRVLDQDGQPVPQATVYLQGKVGGGGQYTSRKALTDTSGVFELLALPSAPDASMTLYAAPPPGSSAGITLKPVTVPRGGTSLAQDVTCGTRMKVRGKLQMPSGSQPAPGVKVVAESIGELPGWPRPTFTIEASRPTDDLGQFEIALDPGQYRFDFIPTDGLPRVSRIVTVRPGETTGTGGLLELTPFTLSKGRRVSGSVSFSGERVMQTTAPYASIRFFRVVNVEGRPSSLLLAQTLTDQNGTYSTTLPTR